MWLRHMIVSTGVSIVLASRMWFWGKMEKENRILYFSCQVFILVNDTPTSFFEISRDMCQEDPLSPWFFFSWLNLFLHCCLWLLWRLLSRMITRAVSEGYLCGFSIDSFRGDQWLFLISFLQMILGSFLLRKILHTFIIFTVSLCALRHFWAWELIEQIWNWANRRGFDHWTFGDLGCQISSLPFRITFRSFF